MLDRVSGNFRLTCRRKINHAVSINNLGVDWICKGTSGPGSLDLIEYAEKSNVEYVFTSLSSPDVQLVAVALCMYKKLPTFPSFEAGFLHVYRGAVGSLLVGTQGLRLSFAWRQPNVVPRRLPRRFPPRTSQTAKPPRYTEHSASSRKGYITKLQDGCGPPITSA